MEQTYAQFKREALEDDMSMDGKLKAYLTEFDLNEPTTLSIIREAEGQLGIIFPGSYTKFLLGSNGGEGSVGELYLVLWRIEDLYELNDAYGVNEFAPGLVIIGSDGGDTAYCLDNRNKLNTFVSVPFVGMALDAIQHCGNNLFEFIKYLHEH